MDQEQPMHSLQVRCAGPQGARLAGVELTADARFAARIRRLIVISLVALAALLALATATVRVPVAAGAALAGGWLLMPACLALSLRRPRWRYALVVPATLVSAGLLAICAVALPQAPLARAGWLLATGGVLVGGLLGGWFWFRWAPVPRQLDDPFCTGRWIGVGLHAALVTAGIALVALSAASWPNQP
jgi:hypothetical protein